MAQHRQLQAIFCVLLLGHVCRHALVSSLKISPKSGALGHGLGRNQGFNRKYKKKGYVFQGRFRSILVEDGLYMRRLVIGAGPCDSCDWVNKPSS